MLTCRAWLPDRQFSDPGSYMAYHDASEPPAFLSGADILPCLSYWSYISILLSFLAFRVLAHLPEAGFEYFSLETNSLTIGKT